MLNMTYVNFISLIQLSICEILYAVMCISKHAKLFESMLLFYDFHAEIQGTGSRSELTVNKCIGDDTKAATRQSPNCIKKTKKIWRKTIFNMADGILTPVVWHVALES